MARWMDKLNKSGCAPGVSEFFGFANLKNYSWRSLKRRLIRSILCTKDDDSFAGFAEVSPASPVAFAEVTRILHGRSQRLTKEKNPAIPTLPAAVISRPRERALESPLSFEQTNERTSLATCPKPFLRQRWTSSSIGGEPLHSGTCCLAWPVARSN